MHRWPLAYTLYTPEVDVLGIRQRGQRRLKRGLQALLRRGGSIIECKMAWLRWLVCLQVWVGSLYVCQPGCWPVWTLPTVSLLLMAGLLGPDDDDDTGASGLLGERLMPTALPGVAAACPGDACSLPAGAARPLRSVKSS